MKILWLMAPSKFPGQIPLVSQNRWFKYMPSRANFIYPVITAYGVSMLLEDGFDVDFVDAPAAQVELPQILSNIASYDLVILEGRTAIMPWLWQLVREFKQVDPGLKAAVYGDHVMARPNSSLLNGFDFVVFCGDYDWGVLQLARALRSGEAVAPVFQVPLMKDLDKLPMLDRKAVDWRQYYESWRHREEFGWIQSGRGCWAQCSFCSWNHTFYGRTIRTMSHQRVFREIQDGHDCYGIREFLDDADTFILKPFGVNLAQDILREKLDVFWNIQTRADVVAQCSLYELSIMKNSGLHIVKLGLDGGNNYTLRRIQKGIDVATIRKAVDNLHKAGLEIHVNMVLGWPWEDAKTAYETINFVKSLKPNQAQFGLIQPFIGTPLYSEALENGWFIQDPDDYGAWDMHSPILAGKMSSQEISKLYIAAWRQFYFSWDFVARQLAKALKLTVEERDFDAFRHLWRGYKAVKNGHLKVVKQ